ncbi:hypothetical protein SUDANB176_06900 [Streptomyces sp. enrichment culture]|uniref:YVTN family beta-propeller repeat protein n=1 Tax=Streptomyces sp. enrichment culture TaxID=1795815 RepID=UPI003F54BEA6
MDRYAEPERARPAEPAAAGAACRVDLAHRVLAHVPVGAGPEGVAVDARTRRAFVACSRDDAVVAVDLERCAVVWRAAVGTEPIPVVFDPPTRRLFTADARSGTVTVLDADSGARVAQIGVGAYPAGLGHDVVRRRVLSGDTAAGTVTAIDADTLEVVGTVPAEPGSGSIAVDTATGRSYCANFLSASLTVFDSGTLEPLGRVRVGEGPCKVAVVPGSGVAYVAESLPSTVARLALPDDRVVTRMPTERAPVGLHVSGEGRSLYVCNRGAGTVGVYDTRTGAESHRITVGNGPGDCVTDPETERLLVSNAGSRTLTVVDRPWLPGGGPQAAAHPAEGRRLPEFSLPDAHSGRIRTTREWAEKKYVINFFASW